MLRSDANVQRSISSVKVEPVKRHHRDEEARHSFRRYSRDPKVCRLTKPGADKVTRNASFISRMLIEPWCNPTVHFSSEFRTCETICQRDPTEFHLYRLKHFLAKLRDGPVGFKRLWSVFNTCSAPGLAAVAQVRICEVFTRQLVQVGQVGHVTPPQGRRSRPAFGPDHQSNGRFDPTQGSRAHDEDAVGTAHGP